MIDSSTVKQAFKDASDDEAKALYIWATACMEIRGLIDITGSAPKRRQRSDAGQSRVTTLDKIPPVNHAQPTLSGLPDEDQTK